MIEDPHRKIHNMMIDPDIASLNTGETNASVIADVVKNGVRYIMFADDDGDEDCTEHVNARVYVFEGFEESTMTRLNYDSVADAFARLAHMIHNCVIDSGDTRMHDGYY